MYFTRNFVFSFFALLLFSSATWAQTINGVPNQSVSIPHTSISDWSTATSGFGGSSGSYQATESNSVATTVPVKLDETLNVVADFGAKGNAQLVTDGAMSSGSKTLTSSSGLFVSGDVGKSIGVVGAGASGAPLVTTIATYVSATQVTLTASASTTVSGAYVSWGNDDTTAIQNALTSGAGKTIRFPNTGKRYLVGPLTVPSNTRLFFMPGATLQVRSGLTTNQVLFAMTAVSNIQILGDGAFIYAPFAEYTSEYNHFFALYAASNVVIRGFTMDGGGGDGVYLADNGGSTYSSNVLVDHITVNHVHRQGVSIISAKHVTISNSTFSNDCCDGNDPPYNNPGMDVEPNGASNVIQDVNFVNNYTYGNKGAGLNLTLTNLSSASVPVSIRIAGLWSDGDGFGSISTQCGTTSTIPGKIDAHDVTSNNSNSFGMYLINWTTFCPVMTIKNPTVINPNTGVTAQEAIAVYQGGGGAAKYGNIDLEDAVIVDNRGTSKITNYLQIADYSNLGVSHFLFRPKFLSGATNGAATEGAQYSIEETYQQTTATPVFDASNGDPAAYFHVTLNKNVTSSTLINTVPGQLLSFEICSSGSFSFVWPTTVSGGSSAPSSGSCLIQQFTVSTDGTTARALSSGGGSAGVSSLNGQTGALTIGSGLVKSTGTSAALTTATAGTDYLSPSTGVVSLNAQKGALTIGAGLVKSTGTSAALTTAVAGTDYMTPSTSVTTTQLPAVAKGRTCEIHIWGDGTSGALQTTDDETASCFNDSGSTMTITAVRCYADNGSTTTTVTPIITGGAATSILTGALTCGNGTFASGTLNGTPTLASAATIDANVTAAGTAKSVRIVISGTF